MYLYHGAYYYAPKGGRRVWLGRDRNTAMVEWAKLVDRPQAYRTMNALFDRYLLEVTPGKAARTQDDDRRAMRYLRAFFGEMSPTLVDAASGYAYLEERGNAASVRANREFAVVRHAMTHAVRWGVVPTNLLLGVRLLPERPRTREVQPKEVLTWYRFAGPMLGAYTALKLLTGLRKGDMLRLRTPWWGDFEGTEGLYAEIGKTGKRQLFVSTPALAHAVTRAIERCSHGTEYIFATRGREPYIDDKGETSGFDSIWQRRMVVFAALGQERFTEHDLRSKAGDDAEEGGAAGHKLLGNSEAQFRRAYQRRVQKVQPVR